MRYDSYGERMTDPAPERDDDPPDDVEEAIVQETECYMAGYWDCDAILKATHRAHSDHPVSTYLLDSLCARAAELAPVAKEYTQGWQDRILEE